jgi:hypothetical protein
MENLTSESEWDSSRTTVWSMWEINVLGMILSECVCVLGGSKGKGYVP